MADLMQLPFARGVDEGADAKGLPTGTPLALENRYHDKVGRVVKRPGVDALLTTILGGGNVAAGVRLITRGDDLALFDGESLLTYSDELASWQVVDRPSPITARVRPLIDTSRSVRFCDVAASGNLLVTFYETGTTATQYLYYEVRRLDTGEIVRPATYVATGVCPRVVMNEAGTRAYLFHADPAGGAGNIWLFTLNMATLVLSSSTVLANDALVSAPFDAIVPEVAGDDVIYAAYTENAADDVIVSSFETATYTVVDTVTLTATAGGAICIATSGTSIHVIYADVNVTLWSADMTLGSAVGPTDIATGIVANRGVFVAWHDTDEVLVGYAHDNDSADAPYFFTNVVETAAHTGVIGADRDSYALRNPSKPWRINGRWYCTAVARPANYDITSTNAIPAASTVLVEIETAAAGSITSIGGGNHTHVGTLENQTGQPPSSFMITKPIVVGTTVYVPTAYRNREPENAATPVAVGFNLHTLTVLDEAWGQTATLGRGAIGASAAPFWWDGASAMPYGFVHAPIIVSAAPAAGGAQADGVYGYLSAYGWRDANGMLHRSPVSPSLSGTTAGGNDTLEPKFSTTSVSSKQRALFDQSAASPAVILIWRTEKDGAIYYSLVLQPQHGVVFNDPRDNDVTHSDGKVDANITSSGPAVALSSQEQVYTATGVLDDVCPPAALAALGHLDRAYLLAGDGHTIWATKLLSNDPTVAPGFNEALTYYFAKPKTCLGALPGAVAVLGTDSIDLLTGGPDDTGTGAWASLGVQTDLGATSTRCLATIPQGLVYRSRRGIELLTTGSTIEWIGEAVQDTLAAYPNVTSAVVVSDKRQVRISCNNVGTTAGRVLVFDYGRNAWSVWNYGFAIADAAMIGNVYTLLRGNGTVYRENATHRDDGVFVESAATIVLTTDGPNAWKQLKHAQLLGTSSTDHTLTMRLKRDFADDYEYEATFSSGGPVTEPSPLQKVRITPPIQKGQGFVLRIEDSAADDDDPTDSGAGSIWESLAVWVQRKSGLPRISASRRA